MIKYQQAFSRSSSTCHYEVSTHKNTGRTWQKKTPWFPYTVSSVWQMYFSILPINTNHFRIHTDNFQYHIISTIDITFVVSTNTYYLPLDATTKRNWSSAISSIQNIQNKCRHYSFQNRHNITDPNDSHITIYLYPLFSKFRRHTFHVILTGISISYTYIRTCL
jgi:hypothetical protein